MESRPQDGQRAPIQAGRSWRASDPRPFASSHVQRTNRVIDLDTITTGIRQAFFLMQPQDSSFQQMLVATISDTPLAGPLRLQLLERVDGGSVVLSEEFTLRQATQEPRSFAANRRWSGRGGVYLAVTGTQQSLLLNVAIEFMTSEIL